MYTINIIKKFQLNEEIVDIKPFGNGHINDTFLVITKNGEYVLQNLNTYVFPDYEGVARNTDLVTKHINAQIMQEEGHLTKEALSFIPCKDGKTYYYHNGDCYRLRNLVPDSKIYQQTDNLSILEEAGRALGKFIYRLDDFDAKQLAEVIPNFHNTKSRYKDFLRAIEEDRACRVNSVPKDIAFIKNRANLVGEIVDKIESKELPLRVTHNDTKLNNILFDENTDKAICLIDLDTVMPGSLLYDFGDAVRISCSTADEEEKDLSKVNFNIDSYRAFTKGFIESIGEKITKTEVEMLNVGAQIMTLEIGMRFLTDYLNGDVYFKVNNDTQNLVRARTQLKMVEEIERNSAKMLDIAHEYYNRVK